MEEKGVENESAKICRIYNFFTPEKSANHCFKR
jgi:hypothetical protein